MVDVAIRAFMALYTARHPGIMVRAYEIIEHRGTLSRHAFRHFVHYPRLSRITS